MAILAWQVIASVELNSDAPNSRARVKAPLPIRRPRSALRLIGQAGRDPRAPSPYPFTRRPGRDVLFLRDVNDGSLRLSDWQ